jgi:hypothetical protein
VHWKQEHVLLNLSTYVFLYLCADPSMQYRFIKSNPILQALIGPQGSRSLRFPDLRHLVHEGGKIFSPTHWPPLPPGNNAGTYFCERLSLSWDHSVAGRIMSLKNSNDSVRNRSRDLPVCSAVPQPLRQGMPQPMCCRVPQYRFMCTVYFLSVDVHYAFSGNLYAN